MNKQIKYILENFDFDKVHKHMTEVDWTWAFYSTVPSVPALIEMATDQLSNVLKSPMPNTMSACGGFHAYKFTWPDDSVPELQLVFAVTAWEGDVE